MYQIVYIYQIAYKSCSIKQTIFNNYATNLKTTISHRSLRISGLLLLQFLNFYFAFLIDNIITYSLYSPYYVSKTSANGNAVYWSRDTRISAYTPFHFSFTVPLSTQNLINSYEGLIRSKVP